MANPLSIRDIRQLRQRLQTCENRIIETANWDTNYFYDGSLPNERYERMMKLLRRRRQILNWMCVYSENEMKRIEELDSMLTKVTQEMYNDLDTLHTGRIATPNMEQYNYSTWLEARLSFNYSGENSVVTLEEDTYYGSQFDKMLNLLSAEEGNLSYRSACSAYRALISAALTNPDKDKHDLCSALLGLLGHPIYSVPDVLRMNSFKIKILMEQERIVCSK